MVCAHQLNRNEFEKDLEFHGLIVLQNSLKAETVPVLSELHHANIRTLMVTGLQSFSFDVENNTESLLRWCLFTIL